jgi:ABC-type glutathione transport system ATPase component
LDDALAALSFERQQKLLGHIKQIATQNVAVILSSDDLKHIFAVTDRILVMYQGRQATLRTTTETTPREIVELIVGSNRKEQVTPVIWAFENYHAAQQQAEELRRTQMVLRESLEAQDSLNRQLIERLSDQVEALDRRNLHFKDQGQVRAIANFLYNFEPRQAGQRIAQSGANESMVISGQGFYGYHQLQVVFLFRGNPLKKLGVLVGKNGGNEGLNL